MSFLAPSFGGDPRRRRRRARTRSRRRTWTRVPRSPNRRCVGSLRKRGASFREKRDARRKDRERLVLRGRASSVRREPLRAVSRERERRRTYGDETLRTFERTLRARERHGLLPVPLLARLVRRLNLHLGPGQADLDALPLPLCVCQENRREGFCPFFFVFLKRASVFRTHEQDALSLAQRERERKGAEKETLFSRLGVLRHRGLSRGLSSRLAGIDICISVTRNYGDVSSVQRFGYDLERVPTYSSTCLRKALQNALESYPLERARTPVSYPALSTPSALCEFS